MGSDADERATEAAAGAETAEAAETTRRKPPRRRRVTCRAAVREVLRERDVSAEDLLVALVDVIVDSHVDIELRERGLGPEFTHGGMQPPLDALCCVQNAAYRAEMEFGKGFGRQPARGTVEDVEREARLSVAGDGSFEAKLSPVRRALRHLLAAGWLASERFLDRVDPPPPPPPPPDDDATAQRR